MCDIGHHILLRICTGPCHAQRHHPRAMLPARLPGAVLCAVAALLLLLRQHVASGQGLLLDSRDMGASGRVQNVMTAYASAKSRAQQLQTHWARMTPSSCSQGKASLCGRDVSSDAGTLSIMASPAAYDSRLPQHTGGLNLVAAPGAQLSCSACVAFAVSAAAETAVAARLRRNASSLSRLSARFLFFCTDATKKATCSSGMELPDALSALHEITVWPDEPCLPWVESTPSTGLCEMECPVEGMALANMPVPRGRFDYTRGPSDSVRSIAQAQRHIRDWGAVVSKFALDAGDLNAFLKRNKNGIYKLKHATPGSIQGHAVTLVGYNNTGGYWIVKNSFGPNWGNGGFFKVAYGNADVLDPAFTYGIIWQPEEPELAPAVKLTAADAYVSKSLLPAPAGCIWYKARLGDYAERIARRAGIPVEQLLNANPPPAIPRDDPGAWLEGRVLKVCWQRAAQSSTGQLHASANGAQPEAVKCTSSTVEVERAAVLGCKPCLPWWKYSSTPSTQHCKLAGIGCDPTTGHVTRLFMANWVLFGTLPPAFGQLTSLTVMDLSVNKWQGTLPASWSCLVKLQLLDLHNNLLNGSVPASFAQMKQLNTLDLSNNMISGELPPALASLSSLETLLLHNNQIGGTIPSAFGAMKSLAYLSVSNNKNLRGCIPAALKGRVWLLDVDKDDYTKEATVSALGGTQLTGFCKT